MLHSYSDALLTQRVPSDARFGTAAETASEFAETLSNRFGVEASETAARRSFASASQAEMTRIAFEEGVDTDAELQTLLVLEKTYVANAKIIEVAPHYKHISKRASAHTCPLLS